MNRADTTVGFGGANNPKLVNVIVSQNRSMLRNAMGIEVLRPAPTVHRDANNDSPRSRARD
jgi:hypothetical protein